MQIEASENNVQNTAAQQEPAVQNATDEPVVSVEATESQWGPWMVQTDAI